MFIYIFVFVNTGNELLLKCANETDVRCYVKIKFTFDKIIFYFNKKGKFSF